MTQKRFYGQRPQRRWLFFRLMALVWTGLMLVISCHFFPAQGASASIGERTYPLPHSLKAVLQPLGEAGDYLDRIAPSSQGYLLWSSWPVQVYLDSPTASPGTALARRQAQWQVQAEGAIADWTRYLPMGVTDDLDQANIVILRQQPPLRWENGKLSRARHAETRFRITPDRDAEGRSCLRHQQTVYVGDRQGPQQLRGTLRHELGHSPNPADVLYAGQIADPPDISQSDLNTLGKLYGQPTRLGCLGGLSETAHGS